MTNLPPGWTETTLGAVCEKSQYGWTTKAIADGTGLRLLRTTDITKPMFSWDTVPFCTEPPPDRERYLLADGDLVISRSGSVGASALITTPPPSVFASYLIRFRPLPSISSRFLYWFTRSRQFQEQVEGAAAGIALQNVNAKKYSAMSLPLPPVAEQHRIVEAIEERFTRLDAAEATLRRATANQERYMASLLQSLVAGAGMPIRRLDELAETSSGGTPSRRDPSNFGGNVPWIKSGELNDSTVTEVAECITEAAVSASSAKLLPKGTLMVAMYGATIGKLGFVGFDSATTNQAVCAIRPGPDVLADYLFWVLRAARPSLTAAGKGGAQPNISQGVLRGWPIPLRSPSEQARVVCEIEERLQAMRTIMSVTARAQARSAHLRRSILGQAFTGHLVSPEAEDEFVTELRAPSPAAPTARRSGKVS